MSNTPHDGAPAAIDEPTEQLPVGTESGGHHEVARLAARDAARALVVGDDEPVPSQEATPEQPEEVALDSPELLFSRELSWMDFDDRVLQLAERSRTPLLERIKFLGIWASNLDEFFMVRVAALHDQVAAGIREPGADGYTPDQVIDGVRDRVLEQMHRAYRQLHAVLLPQLAEHGIRIVPLASLDAVDHAQVIDRFRRQVLPVLTPLAVGVGRPFPYISGLSLSLAALVRDPVTSQRVIARIKVPREMISRLVPVEGQENTYVWIEDVIGENAELLFPGMEVIGTGTFRVTRDADFEISDDADDLLQAVETELRYRRFGEVVRVEVNADMNPELRQQLINGLEVSERQVYDVEGPLDLRNLMQLGKLPGHKDLKDPSWSPLVPKRVRGEDGAPADMFAAIRAGDLVVHHPYDSFSATVERFVEQAVDDPDVLAIKQTVYRTSDDTSLIPSLMRAADRGKQVACLVELKARFDERANIGWARELEKAGVHVVYGHPGLKTHAKSILVVRREGDGVRRYVHVGTGNYHPQTARLYTDLGLFTCNEDIGADVSDMFNVLTGFGRAPKPRQALLAPGGLRDGLIAHIDKVAEAVKGGRSGRIRIKMNALVDRRCIRALYRASQAGVQVEVNVRGVCCLRPGVPGVSDNIRVKSVLGRFLEHSRIFSFEIEGETPEVFMGSADWMPRNLDNRVELVVPLLDDGARGVVLDVLDRSLADEEGSWELSEDGSWAAELAEGNGRSVQRELMQAASDW
ncbi:MAG: polyphosphate kinase 1 [Solirubrobacteraceae bacterium]|nr:polyphosphate kinase 1 [Patulibacter sp.]